VPLWELDLSFLPPMCVGMSQREIELQESAFDQLQQSKTEIKCCSTQNFKRSSSTDHSWHILLCSSPLLGGCLPASTFLRRRLWRHKSRDGSAPVRGIETFLFFSVSCGFGRFYSSDETDSMAYAGHGSLRKGLHGPRDRAGPLAKAMTIDFEIRCARARDRC